MRTEFHESAEEHERYMPHAFDSCVGKEVPFKVEGVERDRSTVVSVTVDDDGRGVTWVVDIENEILDAATESAAGNMSWSFREPPKPDWFR